MYSQQFHQTQKMSQYAVWKGPRPWEIITSLYAIEHFWGGLLNVPVNSNGHAGMVRSPNQASLTK